MSSDLSPLLAVGGFVVVLAVGALALLIKRDLATVVGRGGGGGVWLLGGAFSLGVLGFGVKLVVIVVLSHLPGHALAAFAPAPPPADVAADSSASANFAFANPSPIWRPLPAQPPEPEDNPTTPAKVELGRQLFFDTRLSSNGAVACASCHDVERGAGADGRAGSLGVTGVRGKRNAPTVFNAAYQARLFWDGRASSLEEQALGPLVNPDEMGLPSLAAAAERVAGDPSYTARFARAFGAGAPISIDAIAKAIAAYERTLVTPDSPYDRFVTGDASALDDSQKRGMALFQSLGCSLCHAGPNFSGASLIGVRRPYAFLLSSGSSFDARYHLSDDKGKAGADSPNGVWRIPSLRNVELTAPYFHNGSVATLDEAVRIMAALQVNALLGEADATARVSVSWSNETKELSRYERRIVSEKDIADLVAFLRSLTGPGLAERQRQAP